MTLVVIAIMWCIYSCKSKDNKLIDQARELISKNELNSAMELLDQATTINPDNKKAELFKCKIFLIKDNDKEAKVFLNKALSNPEFDFEGQYFYQIGNIFAEKNQFNSAIACYLAAITNGEEYSNSYALKSNPSPGAESNWFRKFSFYYFACANAYALAGNCMEAIRYYNGSINIANMGLRSSDLMQEVVDIAFSAEISDRKDFREYVGSFYYNRGIVSESFGNTNESKNNIQTANKLKYNEEITLKMDDINCR